MASLCAQIFELDGCWSSILKTHFKILFQKTCQVTSSWSENVTHSQIGIEILSFLAILKDKIKLIPSLPRCIIPPGFEVYQINTFSDGSATCSSFTIFLAMASRSSRRSVLAKASSKSKHHSVPCMEAIAVWLGVESTAKYFTSHMQVFRKVRRISFSLDSECVLYSLNPMSPSSSVLIRNVVTRIHTLTKEMSKLYNIEFSFSYVESSRNPSDLNSKWSTSSDPISLSLTPLWLQGPPELCGQVYPSPSDTYMVVREGVIEWTWSGKPPASALLTNYVCWHPECINSTTQALLTSGPISFSNMRASLLSSPTGLPAEAIVTWKLALQSLPLLSEKFYNYILDSFSMMRMVSAVAKILQVYLPSEIKEAVSWTPRWTSFSRLQPLAPNTVMTQLAFFTIVKTSWHIYGLDKVKLDKHQIIEGIAFASLRLNPSSVLKVFSTNFVPFLPSDDHRLFFRLFLFSHVKSCDGKQAHLSAYLCLSSMRQGPLACLTSRQGLKVQNLIKSCVACTRMKGGREYTYSLGQPLLSNFLDVPDPLFHSISIDLFSGVQCSQHPRSRGKSSFPVSILVAECLATRNVSYVVIEDSKAASVKKGLETLAMRYRRPAVIIADHDSAFTSLLCNTSYAEDLAVKVIIAAPRHQFVNKCERGIAQSKKILRGLREDIEKSIFQQPQTLLELHRKLDFTSFVMGFTPILKGDIPTSEFFVTPRHFSKLLFPPAQDLLDVEATCNMVLDLSVDSLLDIRRNHQSLFREALISHLMSSSVRYNPSRLGDGSTKAKPNHILNPQVGDIILSLDHEGQARVGRILQVFVDTNQHDILIRWRNQILKLRLHTRKIRLLFRRTDLDSAGFPRQDLPGPAKPSQHDGGAPLLQPPLLHRGDCHDLEADVQQPIAPQAPLPHAQLLGPGLPLHSLRLQDQLLHGGQPHQEQSDTYKNIHKGYSKKSGF